jgi:hypothetical protein
MPASLSPAVIAAHADPRYLSRDAPVLPESSSANWMHRMGLPVMAAGEGMDAATTALALRDAGLHEANAFYGPHPSAARVAGTKAAVMLPMALLLDKAYEHAPAGSTRRKVALAAAIAAGALGAFAGAHNLAVIGQAP